MKNNKTLPRNLRLGAVLLLLIAGALLATPQTALAEGNITSITIESNPGADDTYVKDDTIRILLKYDRNVTVQTTNGTPTLDLTIGDSTRQAGFIGPTVAGSDLRFDYKVVDGDDDLDGIEVKENGLKKNDGEIFVSTSNANATLTHAKKAFTDHKVDTTAPTVSSITFTSSAGNDNTYKKDDKIQATVTFSEPVTVTGTPQLTLKVGTTDKTANYKSGSGKTKLIFEYTVASTDTDTDGIAIEASKLALNSGTIKDVIRDATLTHTAVSAQSAHKVDGVAPTVSSLEITSSAGDDRTYKKDDTIEATVTFSEKVNVTGSPTLTLTVGSDDKTADYESGSGTTKLVFEYKVATGDTDTDGVAIAANQLRLNSGTIKDLPGNAATLTHTTLDSDESHKVDGVAPTVSSVTFTSNAGNDKTYRKGDTIQATVTFSEAVTVTGTPQLTLTVGSDDKTADYEGGSGTTKLLFEYEVAAGDADTDGIAIAADKLDLNSGTIKDGASNDATLTHTAVTTQANHKVDGVAPTVSSFQITSSATDNNNYYVKNDKIEVRVTFTEKMYVSVGNKKPYLKLKIGTDEKKAYYWGGTTQIAKKTLDFEYTVATDDLDTDGIEIEANAFELDGCTFRDAARNDATLTHSAVTTQASHKVDAVSPTVVTNGIAITSTAGDDDAYKKDETIKATVTFSEAVTVTGTPQLTLKVGTADKVASYTTTGSTTTKLVFAYTVAAGDTDTDGISIEASKLALNGGTIKDAAKNAATLTHAALSTQADHQVDTTAPTVATNGVAITSSAGGDNTYKKGDKIQATVTFSEKVKVTGTPQLTLTIGTKSKKADYESGSTTTKLVFAYTVAAGDTDTNGVAIAANQLALNSGTIKDLPGNAASTATLTHTAVSAQSAHKVDGVAPTVSSLEITSTGAPYSVGEKIQVTVTFSEAVTVDAEGGTPQLTLNIGGTDKMADYESGSGTTKLVFEYTVATGDADTDGVAIAANQLSLNSGTIKDSVGNAATLTHSALATQTDHKVETTAPTINTSGISITSNAVNNNHYYVKNDTIRVNVTFSEKVAVTGTPQLTLKIGTKDKTASYKRLTVTQMALVFEYDVAAGDVDMDGISIEASKLSLNSGTIKDLAGNAATLTHSALATQASHKVDTISPTVSKVKITSTAGVDDAYKTGDTIKATLTFSETVNVTGTPQLTLKIGAVNKVASYTTTGSTTTKLVFAYTVAAGDTDTDGISIEANQLALNSGTIKDPAGNAATLTHDALDADSNHQVDTTAPTVATNGISITSTATNNYYSVNDTIQVTMTFSEKVEVTGTPQLTLKIGTEDRAADYESGTGTKKLVFEYTVGGSDTDTDGISIETNKLALNGGTITDIPGNTATLTHSALATQSSHKVDGVAPVIVTDGIGITSTGAPYTAGETIQATVTFSENVNVTGTPQLTLTIGPTGKTADYESGSGTKKLVFEYTVVSGDEDTDGISIAKNALALNSGTIKGATAGNPAALKHAALTAQVQHKVDAVVPTIGLNGIAITSTPSGDKTYKEGDTIEATVTFSEVVNVTEIPQLTLKIGTADKIAKYTGGTGTTKLVFGYNVAHEDTDTDGVSIGINKLALNGGTIKDAVDNDANLTHGRLFAQTSHKVDTTQPTIVTKGVAIVSKPSANQTYKTGERIQAAVTFSETVYVAGTPQLTLKIGPADKTALYKIGSGTAKLVFEYTVISGDTDTDGIGIESNKLKPPDQTVWITDAGGNFIIATHGAVPAQSAHKVDGNAPGVDTNGISITSTPGPDNIYTTGEKIKVTVTFTEKVNVTGTPQLTLKIGTESEKANYKSGSGTAKLVFEYTVVGGDGDTDGIEIERDKLSHNGGSIKDLTGNTAQLQHDALSTQADHKVDAAKPIVITDGIALTSSPGTDNTYDIDDKIQATVTFNEKVTVTGTPTLTLIIGTKNRNAAYKRGSGTAKLVFEYTVVTGDEEDTDGVSLDANQLAVENATIRDSVGNDAQLTHGAVKFGDSHQVSTIPVSQQQAPTVSSLAITSNPGTDGTYKKGETIAATVTFSRNVTVTGTPTLTLTLGTAYKKATYKSGSGTKKLIFEYRVGGTDKDNDGIEIEANQLALDGGTIKDSDNNAATLTHTAVDTQATHTVNKSNTDVTKIKPNIVGSPAITSTGSPYGVGETIQATVTFSESVTVGTTGGTPQLTLRIGTDKIATYTRGSGTTKLVFEYTVATGDGTANGISIQVNKLELNGGTIKDSDDNAAVLDHKALALQTDHTVDATPPTVDAVAITSSPKNGTYKIGDTIQATVTFSEAVTVTGTPQLTLTIGNAPKKANWTSGSGTTSLVFAYTVQSGDVDEDGISIGANKLAFNGGTIKDAAGNAATLTHSAVPLQVGGNAQAQARIVQATIGVMPLTLSHKVDGVSPSIVPNGIAITSNPESNNTYKISEKIEVTVTFSEEVYVTGTPQLTLRIGNTNRTATYKSGHEKTKLVFAYTVQSNDVDMDGIEIYRDQLSGGTLKDKAGNVADRTHAALTPQLSHKVDTVVPTIRSIAITSTAGSNNTYAAGEKIQAKVTFSEKVTVTDTPTLTLKIGTTYPNAAYEGGTGNDQLFFTYTVQAGDVDEDGISIDANQLTGGTITDIGGNTADRTNTTLTTQPLHKVGTTTAIGLRGSTTTNLPMISSVSLTSTGPYGIWDNIVVRLTTTGSVTVTGSPTVAVVIGNTEKRASYQSGSGSASLTFQYTVASSDGDDPNGVSVKANSLTGGTLKDTADNALNLNHPALPDQGPTHQVDTTAPQVSSLAFTSAGPYSVGSTIQVTATISEPVTVTGAPSLTLVVGKTERTAGYLSGTGTTALVFGYTVTAADKDDTDGISVKTNALKLNGGTIVDTASNALKLSHSGISGSGGAQAVGITVSGISAVAFTSTGPYAVKDAIQITVTTAETATVTGIPRILMVIGEEARYANYVSGTGTTALVFQYTVVAGDSDTDGVEIPQNALEHYNGSTIKSSYQTALNLSHPSVAADRNHIVDTTQPVITGVAFATDAPAVYTAGSTVEVIVTFAETGVKVNPDENGALPSLSLLFGSNADPDSRKKVLEASYKEARPGSTKLVFTYTVTIETPMDTDGVQIKDNSLRIPASAAITDANGNAVAATPSEDGSAIVGIKPSSRTSSRPILPSFAATGIVFNEFLNAKVDKNDWVELRNTTDTDMSLGGWKLSISVGNTTKSDVVELPDMMLPAGAVLLLVNTHHKENHLERSDAYTYRYFKMPALRLRGSNFSLMLQDRSGAVVDTVSNHTATATGFERDKAYLRVEPSTPGYETAAWQPSGYQGGLGYDRKVPQAASLGTPGHLASALIPQARSEVNISEIMFTPGTSGNLPQWIELYNASKTEVVTLQGWRLQVEIYDPSQQPTHRFITLIFQKTLRILPNQTVLVVTKNGRNSQHFPEQRLYNLAEQNAEKLEQLGPTPELLNDLGYAIVLRDASGTKIDVAGNLDGENRTDDRPGWKLPNCITSNGFRSSIIRQYEQGAPLTGTHKSSWFRATEMRRKIVTYYGHPKDLGNPGWKKGGPLPVQLSSFKAERTEQGALIQWTTASELENAGFNVLRCESKTGTFTVVTPRMLQGAGTTSDRSSYRYVDTTAKAGVAYYYRLEEVSFSGVRQPVATRRLRGHVSAANRSLTTFGSLKTPDYQGNQGNHTNHW